MPKLTKHIVDPVCRARRADEMVPLGRKVTGRRDALVDRISKQITGSLSSAIVLEHGTYDEYKAQELTAQAVARASARHRSPKPSAFRRHLLRTLRRG